MDADDVSGSSTSRRCCQARTHASAGRRRLRRPALRQRIRPLPTTRLDHSASVQRDRSSIFRCNFPLAHFSFILDKKEKKEKKRRIGPSEKDVGRGPLLSGVSTLQLICVRPVVLINVLLLRLSKRSVSPPIALQYSSFNKKVLVKTTFDPH